MAKEQKILISGVKPTGRPHIGNYFGAMKRFVDLQDDYRAMIFIADYHALTTERDAKKLRQESLDIAIDYLAIGLDPKKTVIFRQSDVPEVTELAWIFNCLTTMPFLARAHAYKDALAKNKEVNVGVFDYPILMAADILIQDADVVPVGQDQKQHVEIARDTAEKFNLAYGEIFKLPEPLIDKNVSTIIGTDGRKMSKSYGNTISLFASNEEIEKQVMGIVTDSKGVTEEKDPEKDSVFAMHKLFSVSELPQIEARYRKGDIEYKESKEILIKNIKQFIAPLREKRKAIAENNIEPVIEILKQGGQTAKHNAFLKIGQIKRATGLL
ncbi:MAG: tryptophan--tRNA ligase [Candidatus Lloydbacteria bacterium]|nr:tryptophan--tRNA ligase [Candidatus Lloydbacteria bacterium]